MLAGDEGLSTMRRRWTTVSDGERTYTPSLEQSDAPEARAILAGEYEVIYYRTVERFRRRFEPARRPAIGLARASVAARMIMGENQTCAAMLHGVGNNRFQRELNAGLIADMMRDMQAERSLIDMSDPKTFTARVRPCEAAREKGLRGGQTIELERIFSTVMTHGREGR